MCVCKLMIDDKGKFYKVYGNVVASVLTSHSGILNDALALGILAAALSQLPSSQ